MSHAGGVEEFADINWSAAAGPLQVTPFLYNATVVGGGVSGPAAAISANESWISEVRYPDPNTGQPDASNYLLFTYYSDGAVATRDRARRAR